jgi:hypothetical protein
MKSTFSFLSAGLGVACTGTAVVGFGGFSGFGAKALAQTSYYYAGLSVDGQRMMVDLFSPEAMGQNVKFVYALGNEPIAAQANCTSRTDARTWITLDDDIVHEPQSQGAHNMLAVVCGYSGYSGYSDDADYSTASSAPADESSVSLDSVSLDSVSLESAPSESADLDSADLDSAAPDNADAEAAPLIPGNSAEPAVQTALVFDPPSNVRATPNGEILCSVEASTYINIYENSGSWYRTDACGQIGVIDSSQIRF